MRPNSNRHYFHLLLLSVAGAVMCIILTACGTLSADEEFSKLHGNISSFGAHAVVVKRVRGGIAYSVFSQLPGEVGSICDHFFREDKGRNVAAFSCGGGVPEEVPRVSMLLTQARQSLERYFPGYAMDDVSVLLVPEKVRYFGKSENRSSPEKLSFFIAFRYLGEDEHSLGERRVIRGFAHEFTHLAERGRGRLPGTTSEYRASVAETCVEYDVFGSTVGYESENDFMVPVGEYARRLPAFALRSIRQRAKAAEDMQALFRKIGHVAGPVTKESGGEELKRFCRDLFE